MAVALFPIRCSLSSGCLLFPIGHDLHYVHIAHSLVCGCIEVELAQTARNVQDTLLGADKLLDVLIGDLVSHGDATALLGILTQLARQDPIHIPAYLLDVVPVLVQH